MKCQVIDITLCPNGHCSHAKCRAAIKWSGGINRHILVEQEKRRKVRK